jgi:outer membrane protein assembly factor BamA
MNLFRTLVSACFLVTISFTDLKAVNVTNTSLNGDTLLTDSTTTAPVKKKKRNFIMKFLDYFNDANKEKKYKKFDFSVIGGPHYSSDTKLGLGLAAAGLYHTDRNDPLLQPSNVSLYGDVTTTGFYLLGVGGNHFFPHDKYRLNYNLYFFSFPSLYWGEGYSAGTDDANERAYKRFQAQVKVDFMTRVAKNFYLGPKLIFDYISGSSYVQPNPWGDEDSHTINFSLGFSLLYDSRDFVTNAYRGYYLRIDQRFAPRFLGNKYAFSSTELTTSYYHKVWKGGILAAQYHFLMGYGNQPWGQMATLGSSHSMRGYYEGRYRDKGTMDAQIELRQHVWRRNGVAVWVGTGTVFPRISQIKVKHFLPNYGLGYRWEFKKRVNVRLDYGFGKSQSGFIFNINEAF